MTATVENLLKEALALPENERVELIDALIGQGGPDCEWEEEMVAIVRQRMENVASGRSKLIPAEEVLGEARSFLSSIK
jgi:hypothetical protein